MSFPVRQFKPVNDVFSTWANTVHDAVKERSSMKAKDGLGYTDQTGTRVNQHNRLKYFPPYVNYVGDWNPSGSYYINDMVTVYDGNNSPLTTLQSDLNTFFQGTLTVSTFTSQAFPLGTLWTGQYKGITLYVPIYIPIAGNYVCISNIPSLNSAPDLIGAGIISQGQAALSPNSIPSSPQIATMTRVGNVNYFPVWPDKRKQGVAGYDVNNPFKITGQYWQLISLLPRIEQGCDDSGNTVTNIIDSQIGPPTGSLNVIDPDFIPNF